PQAPAARAEGRRRGEHGSRTERPFCRTAEIEEPFVLERTAARHVARRAGPFENDESPPGSIAFRRRRRDDDGVRGLAGVAEAVSVRILLSGIRDAGAVVARIADAVMVLVELIGIRRIDAIVKGARIERIACV